MELDSPSSTPPQSPTLVPAGISLPESDNSDGDCRRPNPIAAGRNNPVPSHLADLQHRSAIEAHTISLPHTAISLQPAPTPRSEGSTSKSLHPFVTRPTPTGPASLRSLSVTTAFSIRREPMSDSQGSVGGDLTALALPSQTVLSSSNLPVGRTSRDEDVSQASRLSIPTKRKPVVRNPFVSAGFMTEFVGSSVSQTAPNSSQPSPASTPQVSAGKVEDFTFYKILN